MSMDFGMRLLQVPTAATLVMEFMREPFGYRYIGEPGYLSAAQIADGTGVSRKQVYSVMRRSCIESKLVGRVRVYRIKRPPVTLSERPIVRTINGKRCVPAWSHEPDAFKWDGDGNFYRTVDE